VYAIVLAKPSAISQHQPISPSAIKRTLSIRQSVRSWFCVATVFQESVRWIASIIHVRIMLARFEMITRVSLNLSSLATHMSAVMVVARVAASLAMGCYGFA
jgi:hypothetical protein